MLNVWVKSILGTGVITVTNDNSTVYLGSDLSVYHLNSNGATDSLVYNGVGPFMTTKGLGSNSSTVGVVSNGSTVLLIGQSGTDVTLSSAGPSASLVKTGFGPNLMMTDIVSGSNTITITNTANDIVINQSSIDVVLTTAGSTNVNYVVDGIGPGLTIKGLTTTGLTSFTTTSTTINLFSQSSDATLSSNGTGANIINSNANWTNWSLKSIISTPANVYMNTAATNINAGLSVLKPALNLSTTNINLTVNTWSYLTYVGPPSMQTNYDYTLGTSTTNISTAGKLTLNTGNMSIARVYLACNITTNPNIALGDFLDIAAFSWNGTGIPVIVDQFKCDMSTFPSGTLGNTYATYGVVFYLPVPSFYIGVYPSFSGVQIMNISPAFTANTAGNIYQGYGFTNGSCVCATELY